MERTALYEGKAKIIYPGPDDETLVQFFKDDATAFNAQKKDVISGKGLLNNIISEYVMGVLGDAGITTHFIRRLNDREQLIRRLDIVPVEVVVRNVAAGSICPRLGLTEGAPLPTTLVEFCLKDDALGDPIIAREHILTFGWASAAEFDLIVAETHKINDLLTKMFAAIDLRLIDFKLEFGRTDDGTVMLADEISPDNCRLWQVGTDEKMDKDRFRRDLGGLTEAYSEIARRLGLSLPAL
ncbi:MAG: phosphoribosylaminoimidazolesuccinocarboxamide synthase [Candidatus Puniceispirillaceae bacterium]